MKKAKKKFWRPHQRPDIKKSFFFYLVLVWPSKNFFGLFHFFWDISCLRSPLGCSNPISKFNIIPNSKWFKFPISNHSVQNSSYKWGLMLNIRDKLKTLLKTVNTIFFKIIKMEKIRFLLLFIFLVIASM